MWSGKFCEICCRCSSFPSTTESHWQQPITFWNLISTRITQAMCNDSACESAKTNMNTCTHTFYTSHHVSTNFINILFFILCKWKCQCRSFFVLFNFLLRFSVLFTVWTMLSRKKQMFRHENLLQCEQTTIHRQDFWLTAGGTDHTCTDSCQLKTPTSKRKSIKILY